jgi:hypothetical protein
VTRRRAKPFTKRAIDYWANSPSARAPVEELIKQAEREAEERASQIQRAPA